MNDNTNPPVARVTSLAGLTELVPYMIGFTPEESMVLMATVHGQVQVTARVDLVDVQPAGQLEDLLDRLTGRYPDATFLTLAYTEQADTGWAMMQRANDHLGEDRTQVKVLVTGDTWYDSTGASGALDRYGPLAVQAAMHGLRRDNRRSDLADRFQPAVMTDTIRGDILSAIHALPDPHRRDEVTRIAHQLITQHVADGGAHLDTVDAAKLALATKTTNVADLALSMIGDPAAAEQHLALWAAVVNRLPAQLVERPLQLAGVAAWASGNGAVASITAELADKVDNPTANPIRTVLEIVTTAVVPPTLWPELRQEMTAAADPSVQALLSGAQPTPSAPNQTWEMVHPPGHTDPRRQPPAQPGGSPAVGPAI